MAHSTPTRTRTSTATTIATTIATPSGTSVGVVARMVSREFRTARFAGTSGGSGSRAIDNQ